MKKSLLVAPALGVLLLAAAGSVGGTVAWFSSVSSVETQIGTFEATQLDGSLAVDFTAGIGTQLRNAGDSKQGIEVENKTVESEKVFSKMTHASYDHISNKLFTISSEETTGIREVSSENNRQAWKAKDGVYYAVTWTMTFTYTFATESNVNLYFNVDSTLTPADTEKVDAATGFRLAFVGQTAGKTSKRIWAKNQTSTNVKYVKNSEVTKAEPNTKEVNRAGFTYANGEVIDSTTTTKHAEGSAIKTDTSSESIYLGVFEKPNNGDTATISFECVAWFEGTDPNVAETTNQFTALSGALKFYTREYIPA